MKKSKHAMIKEFQLKSLENAREIRECTKEIRDDIKTIKYIKEIIEPRTIETSTINIKINLIDIILTIIVWYFTNWVSALILFIFLILLSVNKPNEKNSRK